MMGLEILLGIGANLTTDFVRSCTRKAVQSVAPIHNHDLYIALIIAFITATEREWKSEEIARQYQEHAQQIRAAFLKLHQDSAKILEHQQASELSRQIIETLVTGEDDRLTAILQPIVEPYLSDVPTEYHEMLAQQVAVSLLEAFGDVLKEDQHN